MNALQPLLCNIRLLVLQGAEIGPERGSVIWTW